MILLPHKPHICFICGRKNAHHLVYIDTKKQNKEWLCDIHWQEFRKYKENKKNEI